MKNLKITLIALAVAFATTVSAQDLTSKKGETILPEAGDYALGFNARPFLNYAGNMFSQAGNVSPGPAYVTGFPTTIVGKMFIEDNVAYRAMVRLNFTSGSINNMVTDESQGAAAGAMVEDKLSRNSTNVTLGLGQEWRRGSTRVQGYWGAMALLNFASTSSTFEYGNTLDANNTAPTSTTAYDLSGANNHTVAQTGTRTTEVSSGATFGLMARGFAGVEVFVFPKISIGMEYGWGIGFGTTGGGTTTTESWDGSAVTSTDSESSTRSAFTLDVDNGQGAMNIIFHF